MSFIAELKRRNVFRVGIAYLIGSWLLAQIAELLLDTFNAPEWTMQFIVVVLMIGFPIAIFFAWAFELTPDGVKRESEVDRNQSMRKQSASKLDRGIIVILVIALAYFVWESRFDTPEVTPGITQTTNQQERINPAPVEKAGESVAVLPFVNMSSDPEQEYFSDGITEEIINALVKIPRLSVPARTSVFAFKGQLQDVRKIGQELDVAHVLEGSIRSQGQQVRITAQLINVESGFHLWSETYDRRLENIFAVQEEIALAIADVLVGELGIDVQTVPNRTSDIQAYDIYLQGRALMRERDPAAVDILKQATQADPDFAPAWAALALAYQYSGYYSGDRDTQDLAMTTARFALSLDPGNVDALTAMAAALRDTWQWAEAEVYFERALAIDPESSELLEDYAEFLYIVGRWEECLAIAERGYGIDQRLVPLASVYVEALLIHGRNQEAMQVIADLNDSNINPDSLWGMRILLIGDNKDDAIRALSNVDQTVIPKEYSSAMINLLNDPQDAQALDLLRGALWGDFGTQQSAPSTINKLILASTGDAEHLLNARFEQFRKLNWGNVEEIWQPAIAAIRQQAQFPELLDLINLPAYWDQTAWPDVCQRNENGGVECR